MKVFSITILSIFILACKKEVKDSGFENYFNKLLVCDSIKTQTNDATTITIVGKGKGQDLLFSAGYNTGRYGTIGTYEIYATPVQKKNFRYERPDKLYYWNLNSTIYEGDYYTIQSATGKSVILVHLKMGADERRYYYYTVE